MPNPRGYPPGSRGVRPGPKRSAFDTARTTTRPFKTFKSAFEQFDPIGQQGERIIDVNDHAVRVVGLKPPSDDPTGILAAMDEAIMAEIKDIAADELRHEEKERQPRGAQPPRR